MDFYPMTDNTQLPPYIHYPLFLCGMSLSSTSKLLYCRLLEEALSYGMKDETGEIYVEVSVEEMETALSISTSSVKRLIRELEENGLLRKRRKRIGESNQLYVLLPKR